MEAVVLSHGSCSIKAGYANAESEPPVVIPSIFCQGPRSDSIADWAKAPAPRLRECLLGVESGRIVDWDVMEDVWRHVLYGLLGWEEGNEGPVFVAEPVLTPKADREALAQSMFESFNVSGLFCMEEPVLALYSYGRLTGCCVDIGHGKTDICAVSEGALMPASVQRWDAGGWDLELLLGRLLAKSERNSGTEQQTALLRPEEQRLTAATTAVAGTAGGGGGGSALQPVLLLRAVKERVCAVAADALEFDAASAAAEEKEFTLPDGQVVYVRDEGLRVGEVLFRPSIVGLQESGLGERLVQSVADAGYAAAGGHELERQRALLENIALVGGGACVAGVGQRLVNELHSLTPPIVRPSIIKAPEYMPDNTAAYASWLGGAIVSKIVFSQNQHVTKGDYDEKGPSVVHRKLS